MTSLEVPPPCTPPAHLRHLEQILNAGWHLLDLIDEAPELALIETGRATLSREPVALEAVLHE